MTQQNSSTTGRGTRVIAFPHNFICRVRDVEAAQGKQGPVGGMEGCCWAGLGTQLQALVPCIHQALTRAGYFPHPWASRWLPRAQQLHKPCKCKGQCCHGIAALWWEAKPARNLGAPGFQLPAESIKQTLTATEKIFGFWRPQVNFGLRW